MSVIAKRSAVGPLLPDGTYARFAVSPDGRYLLLSGVRGDSTSWGVPSAQALVMVDIATGAPVGSFGPIELSQEGIVPVPGGDSLSQRVLLIGDRPGATAAGWVYLLSGPRLTLVDSALVGTKLYHAAAAEGAGAVYLGSLSSIYRLDLSTMQVVDSTYRLGGWGRICVSPDAQRVYVTDFGGFDYPGGGMIQVLDANLNSLASIDVGSANAFPPTLNACAVSRDGRYLLVSSGTSENLVNYPHQPGRLFMLERLSGKVARTVDIGDWESREVFAY